MLAWLLLAVAVLAVIAGTLWFFLRTYHDYSVVDTYSRNSDTSAEYYFRDTNTSASNYGSMYQGLYPSASNPTCILTTPYLM